MAGLGVQRLAAKAGTRAIPGIAAGCAAWVSSDRLGIGIVIAIAVVTSTVALERRRMPLHLMPIAGIVARHAALGLGIAAVALASLAFEPMPAAALAWALVVAWIALDLVLLVIVALERRLATRIAVIGSDGLVRALRGELELAGVESYDVAGRIEAGSGLADHSGGAPIGWVDDLEQVVDRECIDLLVGGATPGRRGRRAGAMQRRVSEKISSCCLERPVSYIGANEFFEDLFAHVPLGRVDATWFEYVLHPRYRTASPAAKRVFGLLGAAAMLAVAAPVILVAAIAIKLTDGGPAIYRQRRIGERGREFQVLKLRTMSVAEPGAEAGKPWSVPPGRHVTTVGAILRRTHLDELPQLWNVIRGEMALVGPRPEQPALVSSLEQRLPFYGRRLLMRPGISGWAQVRCGYSGSITGSLWKLAHDLYYLKHRSILFDLLILLETIGTPIRDPRLAQRLPDPHFVLEAIREEDETGEARDREAELGIDVQRRRFRREGEPSAAPASRPIG